MDLNYSTNLIFPVPIHQFDVNGFSEIQSDLIDYAYKLREKDPIASKKSNQGGWQSFDFVVNDSDDILHNLLINCIKKFPRFKNNVYAFMDAWVNINKTGDYNVTHDHPDCDLSGVLWVKAPKDCGNIVWQTTIHNKFISMEHTPKVGELIVFPNWMPHFTKKNNSGNIRISISGNARPSNSFEDPENLLSIVGIVQ